MRQQSRKACGSLATLAFVGLIPLVLAIGGFSVDCMHVNDQRGALQRATDAGALAGAIDIPAWKGQLAQSGTQNSGTDYSQGKTGTNEEPIDMALAATSLNVVDGKRPVTNGSSIKVFAELLHTYQPTLQQSAPKNPPIACHVTAQMQIRSLFAGFFGNWQQTISSDSIAGPGKPVTTLYRYLPMLLSAPEGDQNGSMLNVMKSTDGYGLLLNSTGTTPFWGRDPLGNSVWIYSSDAINQAAVNAMINGTPVPRSVPPLTIDTTITTQTPGYSSPSALAAFNTLQPGNVVVLPVTGDWLTMPDPKTGAAPSSGPHKIIGFLALKIRWRVSSGGYWCKIVPTIGTGTNTGIPQDPLYSSYPFLPADQVSTAALVR